MENNEQIVKNLDAVVNNESDITVTGDMGVVMADAYDQAAKVNKHIQEIKKELEEKAEELPKSEPEFGKMPDNTYTEKLTLEEGIEDFNIEHPEERKKDGRANKDMADEDLDIHLDYDMQWFIAGLVGCEWPRPITPFKTRKKARKSGHDGSNEDGEFANEGITQVALDPVEDAITVYFNTKDDFSDVIRNCDYYKLEYSEIKPKRSQNSHWNFWMNIYIPMEGESYPMLVEDYLNSVGMTIDQAMNKEWCSRYRKKKAAIEKEALKLVAKKEKERVTKITQKYIVMAGRDSSIDLNDCISQCFAELDSAGYTYERSDVIKEFKKQFRLEKDKITIE